MEYEHISFVTEGNIGLITLNRPQRRNALSLALMQELIACLNEIRGRRDLRAVILAAAGKVFSSGHDLSEMVGRDINEYRRLFDVCSELMAKLQSIPQPVIAEVQGLATAAGCQLVANADLAVAAASAGFAAPGGKGGWFCHTPMVAIARNVGRKRAMELALSGDVIDAQTALDWGLVNAVVPDDELDAAVADLVARVTRGSRASKAIGKRTLYEQMSLPEPAAYDLAVDVMAGTSQDADAREGMRAFLEKRAPRWQDNAH